MSCVAAIAVQAAGALPSSSSSPLPLPAAERVIGANVQLALKHGAEIRAYEPVIEWDGDGGGSGGVRVRTARGEYAAERLVICGGAWSEKLLGEIGVKLTVTRQVLGWVWPKRPELFAAGAAVGRSSSGRKSTLGFTMMPWGGGTAGIKSASFPRAVATDETITALRT